MRGRRDIVLGKNKGTSLDEMMASYEYVLIMETLNHNSWNRTKAAVALQVSRRRLTSRMSVLGFDLSALPRDKPLGRPRRVNPADSDVVAGVA